MVTHLVWCYGGFTLSVCISPAKSADLSRASSVLDYLSHPPIPCNSILLTPDIHPLQSTILLNAIPLYCRLQDPSISLLKGPQLPATARHRPPQAATGCHRPAQLSGPAISKTEENLGKSMKSTFWHLPAASGSLLAASGSLLAAFLYIWWSLAASGILLAASACPTLTTDHPSLLTDHPKLMTQDLVRVIIVYHSTPHSSLIIDH